MSFKKDFLRLVGIIIKPHGLRGELLVKPMTDYPKSFFPGEILYLDEEGKEEIVIEKIKLIKIKGRDALLLSFKNIDSIDSASRLQKKNIYRSASSSPELNKGLFWIDQIISCEVFAPENKFLGVVEDVLTNSSNDVLEVCIKDENKIKENKGCIMLIPMIEDYILKIDINEKKILLRDIPEYI